MVRIINGEIVQDDDPRLRQRQSRPAAATAVAPDHFGSSAAPGQQPPNPLHRAAEALGIAGKTVQLPSVPALGVAQGDVEVIYLLLVAVLTCLFGWRVPVGAAVMYLLMKRSQDSPTPTSGEAGRFAR